jgi:hypothetical protein
MNFYFLILGILGVWRITHLLNQEAGPGEIIARFRRWQGTNFIGQLQDCFYCLSVWVAAPFAYVIGKFWLERILLWPAFSGAAILLERLTAERQPPIHGHYIEEPEDQHVLR